MKTIKQISIFLENRKGSLDKILSVLSNQEIELQAASVADTKEYGLLRLITSDQTRALQLLNDNGFLVNLNEVMAVTIPGDIASFASVVSSLTANDVTINYLYTFSKDGKLVLILKTDNMEKAESVIESQGLELVQGWE
ncbi:MAG: acetolactate synthase [Bacteroidaceae bacterium]|nr:acetolactate synthase [Bacteroidaceae bacterium]